MNSNSHTPIYRFKIIQNELEVEMNRFAILNQYNNHKELKEKYELWLNNSDILQLFQGNKTKTTIPQSKLSGALAVAAA